MKTISLFLTIFVCVGLSAQEQKKPKESKIMFSYMLGDFHSLELKAKKLRFRLADQATKHNFLIKNVKDEDIKRDLVDGKLVISWADPSRADALEVFYKGAPKKLKLNSKDLSADIKNQKEINIEIKSHKLSLKAVDNEATLNVLSEDANIALNSHKGNVSLSGYNFDLKANSIEGDFSLNSFSGTQVFNKIIGKLSLTTNKGSLELEEIEGNINFKSHSAKVLFRAIKGEIRGKSKLGSTQLFLEESNRVRLRTEEGRVKVYMPKNSGSHVNIGTTDGEMHFPKYLELKRYPSIKVATGRLRGRLGGSVFVRTGKGNIKLIQR